MKKALLSMVLLGLFATGTVYAQELNKKDQKTEQTKPGETTELNNPDSNQPPVESSPMKNDQELQKADEDKQFEPAQQPEGATEPKNDTAEEK